MNSKRMRPEDFSSGHTALVLWNALNRCYFKATARGVCLLL